MHVIIIDKSLARHRLKDCITPETPCYYLSDDYATLVQLRQNHVGSEIKTWNGEFHAAVETIRDEYLRLSHEMNRHNHSPRYWESQLASRHAAALPLLRHLVYCYCAARLLRTPRERLILICDASGLASVLCSEARKHGWTCDLHMRSSVREAVRTAWRLATRSGLFLLYFVVRWIFSRCLRNARISPQSSMPRYILRTWTTEGCLSNDGGYRDRNFGALAEFLSARHIEVWSIPLLFNVRWKLFAYLRYMARSDRRFLLPEQYLSLWDGVCALFRGMIGLRIDWTPCRFFGINVAPIWKQAHLRDALSPNHLMYNLDCVLLGRLAAAQVRIDCCIYPLENNAVEKPFILAMRRYYPRARIIGFQHSVWFKEQLGMFLHPDELDYHPLPHQIVCSGERYVDILTQAGFPRQLLVAGPNLRYSMVRNVRHSGRIRTPEDARQITVLLNFDMNHAMELLEKLADALRPMPDVTVRIKSHPLLAEPMLDAFLRTIAFPAPYAWVQGTVQEHIAWADAVVMTGGSVSNLETIAMGVPLIRVALDNNFDFDPLWDDVPFAKFVHSAQELRTQLTLACALSEEQRAALHAVGEAIVRKYFAPVTPESLEVFL